MNYAQEIREFIAATFLFDKNAPLDDDTAFLQNGIIDSTGMLELITFMEERYRITIANEEMLPENLDSVARAARFVARKLEAATILAEARVPVKSELATADVQQQGR